MSASFDRSSLLERVAHHLPPLYPDADIEALARSIAEVFDGVSFDEPTAVWSERDNVLITYGDTLVRPGEKPLETLATFLDRQVADAISTVHILPFCPYSSDDGFAVIDYRKIDPVLGDWPQLSGIASKYSLMADLVINHVSAESEWFRNFQQGRHPGRDFFVEADPHADLSMVVRPRTSPLLRAVETPEGIKHVWCTFSHDQIDLNFQHPEVLLEFLRIIRLYLEQGVDWFRLDAVGYLWKRPGTPCIHLPETHEVIRLLRTILEVVAPHAVLITETNVPNRENLTYFGNRNEAHVIYNFSLAPLVLQALLTGRGEHLTTWMMSMPPAPAGCTYLNFTASHDGIGMRPAEGLLSDGEQSEMIETIRRFGGRVSTRRMADGSEKPYELNVSLFDACQGTVQGADEHQVDRFLCSQTILMGLEGVPAFYIHSLLSTPNDEEAVQKTGRFRSINRHRWDMESLDRQLHDPQSQRARLLQELLRRIRLRAQQPAFHPTATQFTLQLDPNFFGFWRQSADRQQSIFAIHNLCKETVALPLQRVNLISTDDWWELLRGEPLENIADTLSVAPYQTLWLSNQGPE